MCLKLAPPRTNRYRLSTEDLFSLGFAPKAEYVFLQTSIFGVWDKVSVLYFALILFSCSLISFWTSSCVPELFKFLQTTTPIVKPGNFSKILWSFLNFIMID